jgi:hypothetical protein
MRIGVMTGLGDCRYWAKWEMVSWARLRMSRSCRKMYASFRSRWTTNLEIQPEERRYQKSTLVATVAEEVKAISHSHTSAVERRERCSRVCRSVLGSKLGRGMEDPAFRFGLGSPETSCSMKDARRFTSSSDFERVLSFRPVGATSVRQAKIVGLHVLPATRYFGVIG